jgi:hypothetical protein
MVARRIEVRHVRWFGRLLRIYPASFRHDYADEMTRLFAEQVRDARQSGGRAAVARVWAESLIDLVLTAPGHHFAREERVPSPAGAGIVSGQAQPQIARGPRVLLALLPVWLLLSLTLISPGFMDPVFANPPGVLGVPFGVAVVFVALSWMALGILTLWRVSSTPAVTLAFVAFTAPAALAVVLAPALITVVLNFGNASP